MLYHKETREERKQVLSLWQEVFEDAPPEAERYLDKFVGQGHQYTAVDGGHVVAILSCVPCCWGGLSGAYFFALATCPSRRGEGIMSNLMAHVEAECRALGNAFTCLIPASASLFSYYQSRGYKTLYLRALTKQISVVGNAATLHTTELCPKELGSLRNRYRPGRTIVFSDARMDVVLKTVRHSGGKLAVADDAYAVYLEKEGHLVVAEMAAESNEAALALMNALEKGREGDKAILTLPGDSPLFDGEGSLLQAAQYKPLLKEAEGAVAYLRFGIDDLFEKDFENVRLFV